MDENGAPPQSEKFGQLLSLLGDPHRHEIASMWERVVQSELGPDDRAKAERMSPVVKAYLSREIERDEYNRRLAGATVPSVSNPGATSAEPGVPLAPG